MFYQKMLTRKQQLEAEIAATKEVLAQFPEGELFSLKMGSFISGFIKLGKTKI